MDLISRKEAIDALWKPTINPDAEIFHALRAAQQSLIEQLPSAEPEIIRCADCIHWTRTCGDDRWSLGDCDLFEKKLVMCKGYCAWAQRRTDE